MRIIRFICVMHLLSFRSRSPTSEERAWGWEGMRQWSGSRQAVKARDHARSPFCPSGMALLTSGLWLASIVQLGLAWGLHGVFEVRESGLNATAKRVATTRNQGLFSSGPAVS